MEIKDKIDKYLKLDEAYQDFDNILDDITYSEIRDTVFSNVDKPDLRAVMKEFESLLKAKVKDARYAMRTAAAQIVKEIEKQ